MSNETYQYHSKHDMDGAMSHDGTIACQPPLLQLLGPRLLFLLAILLLALNCVQDVLSKAQWKSTWHEPFQQKYKKNQCSLKMVED